ncbi:probable methyltransferase PMT26 [Typha angustifolia]|uniref:probable methyltransferase PMT26 n=1 Tax=Typha angustifolia TaxID=59011 RepID=UPI003C2DE1F0
MMIGRSTRIDGRRPSSSYCSTAIVVVFVALSLVGVWMMTSSTIIPVEMSSLEIRSQATDQASRTKSQPSEQSSGEVAKELVKESLNEPNLDGSQDQNLTKKTNENPVDKIQEEFKGNEGGETIDRNDPEKNRENRYDELQTGPEDNSKETENDGQQQQELSGTEKLEQEEKFEGDRKQEEQDQRQIEMEQNEDKDLGSKSKEMLLDGAQFELLNETDNQNKTWSTQAAESKDEKDLQASSSPGGQLSFIWKLCNATAGSDYIPCLDNEKAIKKLRSTKHYEHRERHCPEEPPTCLVPLQNGYKRPIEWPKSRDMIWYNNVPHTKLVAYKGHQNWVKVSGEYLTFPGGGTQFKHGALHYIDFIQESLPDIAWGKRSRVVLDVGCGVASFGGYLFDRDVLTMSFAPKDEHEAQVQFALERGIPAISAVMGTKRLPFPSRVFDVIHCARCRVPWHIEGGKLLLELNRLLRPGGYFVWSATPVYRKVPEDAGIWNDMSALTKAMCWDMVKKTYDKINEVGLAIFRKPSDNKCYEKRPEQSPPLCQEFDQPDAAWNIPLQACMHKLPVDPTIHGSQWPDEWPLRLEKSPYWLNSSQVGVYGKPAPEDFVADYEHWKRVVSKSYLYSVGINWSRVRNVLDMRSIYGGFAAALRDLKVWVMNIVSVDSPDTLPIIYERGLFGMYHDWCESFSTYPRTYDLLHSDHLFSKLKKRCKLLPVIAEVDRILRPEGFLIVRDNIETISELENIAKSLQWEVRTTYSKDNEGFLCIQKTLWRPKEVEANM